MSSELTATEYRRLVEHSPVMIWRAGLDAKCDYFNDAWLTFTGRSLQHEMGDGWAEGVHTDDLQSCVDNYLDHFRRREPFEMEYRLRRHDGVFRWIFDRGAPYTSDDGQFAGFIGSCVDVDDRRRAEDARERHDQEQLALAREFEHWILAIVSHDIRNPVSAISTSATLLEMSAGADQRMHTIAEQIARSAARITNIVGDLLDLSRRRHGGGIPIEPAQTDLRILCRDVAAEIATFAEGHKVEVACEGEAIGMWDPNRISQALSNLVANAVKHGAPGEPVAVRVMSNDQHAIVEVHNEGAIPIEIMPKLFRPFAVRSVHRGEGLGLGLFIAKLIAHAHSGELHVASSAESGTTFRLILPRGTTTREPRLTAPTFEVEHA
jgi:two-component system CheB/CheR fusion protein